MQKFYLLYPNEIPAKVCSLSYEHIKILINICNSDKRNFYTDMCIYFSWDTKTLKRYILNDVYEKFQFLKRKEKIEYNQEILEKVLEIQSLIFED